MDARDYFGYKNPDEEPGGPDPADGADEDGDRPPLFEEAVTLDDPATPTAESPTLGLADNAKRLYRLTVAITRDGEAVDRFEWWLAP